MFKNKTCIILLLLVMLASCGKKGVDLNHLQLGDYYVAQCNGRDVVLQVENVSKKGKLFQGCWYAENGDFAKPHHFTATTGRSHRTELRSDSLVVKAEAQPGGDTLVLDLLLDGSWQTLRFLPWQQPPVMSFQPYPYYDSLYEVTREQVEYAQAKGFWVSYSADDAPEDYLSIVLEKMNMNDLTQKNLALTMDVYRPKTNDTLARPLLMLIHGGAFFNGDKRDMGYEEWGHYFASRGYIVACINYRIGFKPFGSKHVDRAGYRGVQDAHAAMCYLLRDSKRYHIDSRYLFVGGTSAGGITALNLAFMTDEDRPECTKAGLIYDVSKAYNKVVDIFTEKEHNTIGMEDLGNINAVAVESGGDVKFTINTVINMWGAVHKIEMLGNSPSTAILSFHGDADSVVAYGYDYPFNAIKTPARDFIEKVQERLEGGDSRIKEGINEFLGLVKVKMPPPLNHILCNKMYGSYEIHKAATSDSYKMVSELHTKKGGGHSLQDGGGGMLSDYYDTITDVTTKFLYVRMFPRPALQTQTVGQQQWFELHDAGMWMNCRWEAEGGLVLEAEPGKVRAIFFEGQPHKLRVAGQGKDNKSFTEEYDIR